MSFKKPADLFDLSGKTALVTGSSRGLGHEFAGTLAAAGARVVLHATNTELLNQVESDFKAQGLDVCSCAANLLVQSEIDKLVKFCKQNVGHIDILVANAGVEHMELVQDLSTDGIQYQFQVNVFAPMLLTSALVPDMKKNGWGRLIYLSSISAHQGQGMTGHSIYSASKAALDGFLHTASVEVGPFGITANSISPGVFLTDMAKDNMASHGEAGKQLYDAYAAMTAVGHWGDPENLAGALLLLASDAGSYITGTTVLVDGGTRVMQLPAAPQNPAETFN